MKGITSKKNTKKLTCKSIATRNLHKVKRPSGRGEFQTQMITMVTHKSNQVNPHTVDGYELQIHGTATKANPHKF